MGGDGRVGFLNVGGEEKGVGWVGKEGLLRGTNQDRARSRRFPIRGEHGLGGSGHGLIDEGNGGVKIGFEALAGFLPVEGEVLREKAKAQDGNGDAYSAKDQGGGSGGRHSPEYLCAGIK